MDCTLWQAGDVLPSDLVVNRTLRRGLPEVVMNSAASSAWYADHIEMEMREDDYGMMRFADAPLRTVLDLGGNVGFFALYAALIFPDAIVHVFEPQKDNYRRLVWNICANGLAARIFAHPYGISDRARTIKIVYEPSNPGGSITEDAPGIVGHESIDVLPLADIVTRTGMATPIDLLKIDCELCEYAGLRGVSIEYLQKNFLHLGGEWHSAFVTGQETEELLAKVRAAFPASMPYFVPPTQMRPLNPPRGVEPSAPPRKANE